MGWEEGVGVWGSGETHADEVVLLEEGAHIQLVLKSPPPLDSPRHVDHRQVQRGVLSPADVDLPALRSDLKARRRMGKGEEGRGEKWTERTRCEKKGPH